MKLTAFLAFTLLTISILSYGITGAAPAFATSDPNPALPISTNVDIVKNGDSVIVSGNATKYDPDHPADVTFKILSPDNNPVGIAQISPNSDGSFEKSLVAGGKLWKISGDYTISVRYGTADTSTVTVNYVGGERITVDTEPDIPAPDPLTPEPPAPKPPAPEPPAPKPPAPEPPAPEPPAPEPPAPEPDVECGRGTELVDGACVPILTPPTPDDPDSGCLIATAAYGTELAPQVQLLREIRDNTLFSTASGTSFMSGFNTIYYSFAPTVADWERESPLFKEMVKTAITPMLASLSIMSLANEGSELEVLGLGISVIALNLGMYIAAPAMIGYKVRQQIKSRN